MTAVLANTHSCILGGSLAGSFALLPNEIRHTKRANGCHSAGGVVNVATKARALFSGFMTLFNKLNVYVAASAFWTFYEASFHLL